MAGDTSLWPVVVGGLIGVGGTLAGTIGTFIRDWAQQRREAKKRRAEKYEELVAAVFEFDHWVDRQRRRLVKLEDIPETVDPFGKVQSISSVYFPKFSKSIDEMDAASSKYYDELELYKLAKARRQAKVGIAIYPPPEHRIHSVPSDEADEADEAVKKAGDAYNESRDALITSLRDFARKAFQ
jgi:hypothetical protein